ncbi:hypothetical protein DSUL_30100 [Desulfovibrionales bacterium]
MYTLSYSASLLPLTALSINLDIEKIKLWKSLENLVAMVNKPY